jgi:DNA-binding transcriptional MerR regulator/ABC-type Fe3+-hydroxamate transport system substrate-binding protein
MKTIGEVAELAGVSTDTLRWYDKLGLLKPCARSEGGYRLYGRDELLRLREILIWRQLGFPLSDIQSLIDEPEHDLQEAVRRQLGLAASQLDKFHAITRGLELAAAAIDAGRSLAEDDVFQGFARSLSDDEAFDHDAGERARPFERIALFGAFSSRPPRRADRNGAPPKRIVGRDPIRMAENLLALGVVPLGSWKYQDRLDRSECAETAMPSGVNGEWPWSPYVEPIVRRRIRELGAYTRAGAIETEIVEALRPDLIFCWASAPDAQRFGPIAPLAPLEWDPDEHPAFMPWIREMSLRLGLSSRFERLVATWDARTQALRVHLEGHEVSVVNVFGRPEDGGVGLITVPTERFEAQVFTDLGLRITRPSDATPAQTSWNGRLIIQPQAIDELDAPMLFMGAFHVTCAELESFISSRAFRKLPAVRHGHVTQYDWSGVRSGWFGAHWQLYLIARAFGLTQLQVGDATNRVHAVINESSGMASFVRAYGDGSMLISGPDLGATRIELSRNRVTSLSLPPAAAVGLCDLPEVYVASFSEGNGALPFAFDRESALERIAAGASSNQGENDDFSHSYLKTLG